MRTLPDALLAAQRSASAIPYLKVRISDRIAGVQRLNLSRLYAGSEPDSYHAAVMPGDGSLLRARVSGGRLYYQRVAAPGPSSDFSAWTDLAPAANADVALCAEGSRALLFYVDTDGITIKLRESTDNGATLGSPATVATATGAVGWLAADVKSDGDALLVYSVGATVYGVKRSGGSWGTPAAWSNSVGSVAGLACHHLGDYNLAVAGKDTSGQAFLWTCVFGDDYFQPADTWSSLWEVARASSGSGVAFQAPFLDRPDTFRLTFIEEYSGTEAYSRPYHTFSPPTASFFANLWREPIPFDLTSSFGLAVASDSNGLWLSTPSGVWTTSLSTPELDVTTDLLEAEVEELPLGSRLVLVLRNDDGRYSTLPEAIKPASEVEVSPGYVTTQGPLTSEGPAYWLQAVEHLSGGGRSRLILRGGDAWTLLEGWRARRQYAWAAGEKNVFGILQYIFARAGLELSSAGASAAATSLYPAFTVHPGESGLTAVRRLLDMLPDVIYLRGRFAYLKEPLDAEASSYAYGLEHPILFGRYVALQPEANRVQVFGQGVFVEAFDWPGVEQEYDRLQQVYDANLTAPDQAQDRASALLRRQQMAATGGEIRVPVNCGQELYDVIELTDAAAGLAAARRRVRGITLRYSTGPRPTYEQRLALSGV